METTDLLVGRVLVEVAHRISAEQCKSVALRQLIPQGLQADRCDRVPLRARAPLVCACIDRCRMPIAVIDGALATHPIVRSCGSYHENAFYDDGVQSLRSADPLEVNAKLAQLGVAAAERPQGLHTRPTHKSRRK